MAYVADIVCQLHSVYVQCTTDIKEVWWSAWTGLELLQLKKIADVVCTI